MYVSNEFKYTRYPFEADEHDQVIVLALQLYSILGFEVKDNELFDEHGRAVDMEEELASFKDVSINGNDKSFPPAIFFLIHADNVDNDIFDIQREHDWQTCCTRLIAPNVPLVQSAYRLNDSEPLVCASCAQTCYASGISC